MDILKEQALREVSRRPASVANAIPVGVSLDRERVGSLASGSVPPVLWEANRKDTRHLLYVGSREGMTTFGRTLAWHVLANPDFWDIQVLAPGRGLESYFERSFREVGGAASTSRNAGWPKRLLVVVSYPETQEAVSLLTEFARRDFGRGVHVAVLAEKPGAIPNTLMRALGFRIALAGTTRAESRDVVGDASAATLPAEAGSMAAVIFDKERGRRDVVLDATTKEDLEELLAGQSRVPSTEDGER